MEVCKAHNRCVLRTQPLIRQAQLPLSPNHLPNHTLIRSTRRYTSLATKESDTLSSIDGVEEEISVEDQVDEDVNAEESIERDPPPHKVFEISDAFIEDWQPTEKQISNPVFSLTDPQFDVEASKLLLAVPEGTELTESNFPSYTYGSIYTFESLHHILRTTKPDIHCTIIMAHLVKSSFPFLPLKEAGTILRYLVRNVMALQMSSVLPSIVNMFFQRLQMALKNDELTTKRETQDVYARFIEAFKYHSPHSRTSIRRRRIDVNDFDHRSEIVRIFRHLIQVLDSMPSSSDNGRVALKSHLVGVLVDFRIISTPLSDLMIKYAISSGTKLRIRAHDAYFDQSSRRPVHDLLYIVKEGSKTTETVKRENILDGFVHKGFQQFAEGAMPYLRSTPETITPEDQKTREYVWSMLLTRVAEKDSVEPEQILELYSHVPGSCLCAKVITPVVLGLSRLKAYDQAWMVWCDAVAMEQKVQNGRYVDKVLLGAATRLCSKKFDLTRAVQLLDTPAKRPGIDQGIQLDAQNVNTIMSRCLHTWKPSVAFRIFAASQPRWGVKPNGRALETLLKLGRFYEFWKSEESYQEGLGIRRMIKEISTYISPGSEWDFELLKKFESQYPKVFTEGDYTTLIDPPNAYGWTQQNGHVKVWEVARELFRKIIHSTQPHIEHVESPLKMEHNFLIPSSFYGKLSQKGQNHVDRYTCLPLPDCKYTHIVPSTLTWHHYIMMLGTIGLVEEIPLTLAWMKSCNVKPFRYTLSDALMYIAEVEGPKRYIEGWKSNGGSGLARDQDVVRKWLMDWLGSGETLVDGVWVSIVPSEEEVTERRLQLAGEGRELIRSNV